MQVARLLEPRKEKSVASKVRQMARALQLESQYAKSIILDLYLGLAPYGGNIEGVRAASLAYFRQGAKTAERRRGGAPRRFAAIARSAAAGSFSGTCARRARTVCWREPIVVASSLWSSVDEAMQQDVPHARLAFPHLAPHAAEAALRADKEHGVHHLTLSAAWQAPLEQLARESAQRLGPENFGGHPRHRQRDRRNPRSCRRRRLFFPRRARARSI